jgi:DNA-binding transcriptional ArsR family regulator
MENRNLNPLLQFFKVLANENRLKMLSLLANRESNVSEISAFVGLRAPTVSHHLSKLGELDLVKMRQRGNDHLYSLNVDGLYGVRKEILALIAPEKIPTIIPTSLQYDPWEMKILNTFVQGERIRFVPAQQKKKLVLLRWLLEKFEKERAYTEKEVNEIIEPHYSDYCTLRRYLVDFGFMTRHAGIYQRFE